MKDIPSLNEGFNPVSVKAGDTFEITLIERGAPGTKYNIEEINGQAERFAEGDRKKSIGHGEIERTFAFKAKGTGDVEIVAQATMRHFDNRKVRPLSFQLTVK